MGYKSEDYRCMANKNYPNETLMIKMIDGFITGDRASVAIIWNNLTGCNFDNENDHKNYLENSRKNSEISEHIELVSSERGTLFTYKID